MFERLGVADAIKDKLKSVKAAGEAVANGEAEIGFTQVSEILPFAGADVGGTLPPDVQSFTELLARCCTARISSPRRNLSSS